MAAVYTVPFIYCVPHHLRGHCNSFLKVRWADQAAGRMNRDTYGHHTLSVCKNAHGKAGASAHHIKPKVHM